MASSVGIRNLKNHLSRYVREAEAGARISVTDHGRVVAELVPPPNVRGRTRTSRHDELVAAGIIRPALKKGNPLAGFSGSPLPKGTAAMLLDADRDEG